MMTFHLPARRALQGLIIALLLPLTVAQAAYQCVTPSVTETYLRDMDQRIEILEKLLEGARCADTSKITLFGMDFYPDPASGEDTSKLTGDVFNTGARYLAQSMAVSFNETLGLKEFFLSIGGTQDSYQLHLDVQQAQRRLDRLRELLSQAQQACAQEATIDGIKLPVYTETWYYTYRQLYFWLLLANQPTIPEEHQEVPTTLLGGSTILNTVGAMYSNLARERLEPEAKGKWYADTLSCSFAPTVSAARTRQGEKNLPQNFFSCNVFYTKEYATSLTATCQSPELNMQGLEQANKGLENAIGDVGKRFTEIGEAAQEVGISTTDKLAELEELLKEGDVEGLVRVRSNIQQAGDALRANLQEWLTPAESASRAQQFLDKVSSPVTSKGQSLSVSCLSAGGTGGTIGGILGEAFSCEADLIKARKDAEGAMNEQLQDTLSIRRQYEDQYNQLGEELENLFDLGKDIQYTMTSLCKTHLPGEGEDCGQ